MGLAGLFSPFDQDVRAGVDDFQFFFQSNQNIRRSRPSIASVGSRVERVCKTTASQTGGMETLLAAQSTRTASCTTRRSIWSETHRISSQ